MHKHTVTVCPNTPMKKAQSAGTQGICECVCACEPRDCHVCVLSLLTLCLHQLKRRKGTWLSMFMFGVSPIHRSCWTQHLVHGTLCAWPCQFPLCVCVWDACSASLPVELANSEVAAVSLSLGRDPRSL